MTFTNDIVPGGGKNAKDREISNPEPGSPRRITWARYTEHAIDRFFHAVASWDVGGSVVTACHGRWPVLAASERSDSPPFDERCEPCQRFAIERAQVERGLDELAAHAGEGGR